MSSEPGAQQVLCCKRCSTLAALWHTSLHVLLCVPQAYALQDLSTNAAVRSSAYREGDVSRHVHSTFSCTTIVEVRDGLGRERMAAPTWSKINKCLVMGLRSCSESSLALRVQV